MKKKPVKLQNLIIFFIFGEKFQKNVNEMDVENFRFRRNLM